MAPLLGSDFLSQNACPFTKSPEPRPYRQSQSINNALPDVKWDAAPPSIHRSRADELSGPTEVIFGFAKQTWTVPLVHWPQHRGQKPTVPANQRNCFVARPWRQTAHAHAGREATAWPGRLRARPFNGTGTTCRGRPWRLTAPGVASTRITGGCRGAMPFPEAILHGLPAYRPACPWHTERFPTPGACVGRITAPSKIRAGIWLIRSVPRQVRCATAASRSRASPDFKSPL